MDVAKHLGECPDCHRGFTEELRSRQRSDSFGFSLAPEFWFRHDHIDFNHLVSLADSTLDETQHQIIDAHLKACETCREDVRSFLAFRKKTAPEMEVSYAAIRRTPSQQSVIGMSWWQTLTQKPAYAISIIVLTVIAIAIAAMVLKRTGGTLEARKDEPPQNQAVPSPTSANDLNVASLPSPEPPNSVETAAAVATLEDGPREVILDRSGRLTGLEDVTPSTQQEIASALMTERIERPAVLNDLVGEGGALRGTDRRQSFKLLSPERAVIIEDRPKFRWEKLPGSSQYRVYVGDSQGREAASSEELPSERTEWIAPSQLKRGEVYSWSVVALVDGKEVVSPGASSPEMKFRVLSDDQLRELNGLKKTRSHLALSVFYARAGLVKEAEQELQKLIQMNPRSEVPRKLLRSLQSMRESNHR